LILFSAFLYSTGSVRAQEADLVSFLPKPNELQGWHPADSVRLLGKNDLFTLIDGGADIYLEYGFRKVLSVEYLDTAEQMLRMEIYEMTDAPAAFGIYSLNIGSMGTAVDIGNAGVSGDSFVMFWKNRFLVYVSSDDTGRTGQTMRRTIAASIDHNLGLPGKEPNLLQSLPPDSLKESKYIRGPIGLSSIYIFSTEDVLKFTEGAVGVYPGETLFVFRYPARSDAGRAFLRAESGFRKNPKFRNHDSSGAVHSMEDKNGSMISFSAYENFLILTVGRGRASLLQRDTYTSHLKKIAAFR
jgi:hypothetical protein